MHITPRRLGRAFPVVGGLLAVLAMMASCPNAQQPLVSNPITAATNSPSPGTANSIRIFSSPYFYIGLLALGALLLQTWVNYIRDWYNPSLALKYQDIFESEKVRKSRSASAVEFKDNKTYSAETKKIEDVLDVLEDIGFYVENDEMSVEVVHHHFYHWIRGYVQTAKGYIDNYRREESTAYDHCEFLLEVVSKLESKKTGKQISTLNWDEKSINEFIEDEIAESTSDES